ncbi:MAG: shikimate kinase [Candidatus Cryptobacteroides sp.]
MIISLTGFMFSGKSCVGERLALALGWDFVDLDRYIEQKCARSINEIFALQGEDGFRAIEAEALRDQVVMHQLQGRDLVLSLGGGSLQSYCLRPLILEQTLCIWLKTSADILRRRMAGHVQECGTRPLLKRLLNEEGALEELLAEREKIYSLAPLFLESSPDDTPDSLASRALELIKETKNE